MVRIWASYTQDMRKGLISIDKLLLYDANLRRLSRPSKRVYQNFLDFIYTEQPFNEAFMRFIYHKDDFVLLEDREDECWLDNVMHIFSVMKFLQVSQIPVHLNKTNDLLHSLSVQVQIAGQKRQILS